MVSIVEQTLVELFNFKYNKKALEELVGKCILHVTIYYKMDKESSGLNVTLFFLLVETEGGGWGKNVL